VSGLNQQFAKLSYGKLYRGFESPLLREEGVGVGVCGGSVSFNFAFCTLHFAFHKDPYHV
jgi:hypothetical protein